MTKVGELIDKLWALAEVHTAAYGHPGVFPHAARQMKSLVAGLERAEAFVGAVAGESARRNYSATEELAAIRAALSNPIEGNGQ